MKNLPLKAVLMAIFCNILFGSASPFIKLGYEYLNITDDVYSKLLYAGVRFFVSGIAVFIVDAVMTKKIPKPQKGNGFNVVLLGITYTFLQYIFFYVGLSHTTGASATVINSSSVFMAIVLAHFIYKNDKLTLPRVVGCVLGFAGVVIACFAGGGMGRISFMGEGFILLTALFFVLGSVISKKASKLDSSFTLTAYNLLIGGFLLIVAGLVGYRGGIEVTTKGILVLAYLIFVSSAGFTMWSILLKNYPIGKISVYNFVIPVSGTILSGIFLKENIFTWQYMVALALVSAGIYIVNKKKNLK